MYPDPCSRFSNCKLFICIRACANRNFQVHLSSQIVRAGIWLLCIIFSFDHTMYINSGLSSPIVKVPSIHAIHLLEDQSVHLQFDMPFRSYAQSMATTGCIEFCLTFARSMSTLTNAVCKFVHTRANSDAIQMLTW